MATDYDSYYWSLSYLYSLAPNFTDFGLSGYPEATKYGYTGTYLAVNRSVQEIQSFLRPIALRMETQWNVSFSYLTAPDHFFDTASTYAQTYSNPGLLQWILLLPQEYSPMQKDWAGRFWVPMLSRLMARSAMTESNLPTIYDFVKTTLEDGATHMAYPNIPPAKKRNRQWNFSLNPAWKDAAQHFVVLNYGRHSMQDITYFHENILGKYSSLMDKLSQNRAAYINEVRDELVEVEYCTK
jgi:hypothetical protein